MKQLLSIWLVPQKKDEEYLQQIIDKLAVENNSPLFIPHLTLFGDITIELEQLKSALDKVFDKLKPFTIKKLGISQSELFFKTVFVEFKKSQILGNLFTNLAKETKEKKNFDDFKPHISLIYKLMPEQEKSDIIKNLDIKDEFIIDRVFINAPRIGQNDFYDVEGWRVLYQKALNH